VVPGGAQSIAVDLTTDEGVELALKLVDPSDVLIASCRQGVMEQPGLSPQTCLEPNPRPAVIGGHGEGPMPQPNLVGEYGGGRMMLGEEVVAARWLAARTGGDQVVDAAMVDGSAVPMARFYRMKALGHWIESGDQPGRHRAPFYDVYPSANGDYPSVGRLEPAFFATLLDRLGIDDIDAGSQYDPPVVASVTSPDGAGVGIAHP
jgi:alpha-methylacyl-CoA racemase